MNYLGRPYGLEFHQLTPMLEDVLCTSAQIQAGLCHPSDPQNRIIAMIVHLVHQGFEHWDLEPRLITLDGDVGALWVVLPENKGKGRMLRQTRN
jgi:hypothetical protein